MPQPVDRNFEIFPPYGEACSMNKEILGIFGLLSASILWGLGFLAVDRALTALSPVQTMVIRFFLASLIMLFAARKDFRTASKQEIKAGCIMGLCLFIAFILQTIGLQLSSLANNAFLTATNVVFVPFLVWGAYKKRPLLREFAGMILALVGVGFLTLTDHFSIGIGDSLSLGCAVFFACHVFFTGNYAPYCRVTLLNFFQVFTAFILSCAAIPFTGGRTEIVWNKYAFWSILYLGIVSTALTYFLQAASQRYVKQVQAVIILSLEAVFGTFFSIFLMGNTISPRMVCGAVLILTAVLISAIKLKKNIDEKR